MTSASLIHKPAHVQSQRLLPLRNWSSTSLRANGDLCTLSGRVFSSSKAPLPTGMVRGGTVRIQIPCCTRFRAARLAFHRTVARIGRNGNLVSHHSLSLSFD